MKAKSPLVIALALWFLYFATNAFAVFKSPYPQKADPPDFSEGCVDSSACTASKPK